MERLESAPRHELAGLTIPDEDQVFEATWKISDTSVRVLLVEPAVGEAYMFIDSDLDGVFSSGERFDFSSVEGDILPEVDGEIRLDLPAAIAGWKRYPLRIWNYSLDDEKSRIWGLEKSRMILRSVSLSLEGFVDIRGTLTKVEFRILDRKTGEASIADGRMGVDSDQDGRIDADSRSPEFAYGHDENVVFRVGQYYVSKKEVDTATGRIVLRAHDASDYRRIELIAGTEVPDFAFTDFDGKNRTTSEFRGKYLLLDFWGAWCGPCVRQFSDLKEVYKEFHESGFEILGMDYDPAKEQPSEEELAEGLSKARELVQEKGVPWPQATTESILDLIVRRFRIIPWPTLILLDPQGRILSIPETKDELVDTLKTALTQDRD